MNCHILALVGNTFKIVEAIHNQLHKDSDEVQCQLFAFIIAICTVKYCMLLIKLVATVWAYNKQLFTVNVLKWIQQIHSLLDDDENIIVFA